MVEDVYSQSAAQHERYVGVPRHRWLYYEYDTGDPEDAISRKRKLSVWSMLQVLAASM